MRMRSSPSRPGCDGIPPHGRGGRRGPAPVSPLPSLVIARARRLSGVTMTGGRPLGSRTSQGCARNDAAPQHREPRQALRRPRRARRRVARVEKGRIQGIIGPNGAGNTTLFNVINGIYRADGGRVAYGGVDITRKPLNAIASLGIGRTFQVARVFNEMTLLENMLVPAIRLGLSAAAAEDRAMELLALARLDGLARQPAVEISGGQKKLLEFMRTLMADPPLVLLDEPFNGINPALIELLVDIVLRLNREQGKTFLLISHEMPHVTQLCERVFVLNAGKTIAEGAPAALRENPLVIEAYLGH